MEFSLKRPTLVADSGKPAKTAGVANLAATDSSGTSARAYLKTAQKAKDAENFKREAELIEKAIATMGAATPSVLRRYAASLYKCGEFRAAQAIITSPACQEGGNNDYVKRIQSQLNSRVSVPFEDILGYIS